MTDGNMGIQVAPDQVNPPTGDEMNRLQSFFNDFFQRAATTFVQASDLAKQVQELSAVVASLKSDVEYVRQKNRELDEALAMTREQRDNARRELAETRDNLSQVTHERDTLASEGNSLRDQIADLREQLSNARKERDDWAKLAHDEGEAHKLWKGRAEEGRKRIADLASLFAPEPEPVEQGHSTPAPEPAQSWGNAQPADFGRAFKFEVVEDYSTEANPPQPNDGWSSHSA